MAQLKRLGSAALIVAIVATSSVGYAQPVAPSFACETQDLVIGAAEMNGVRVICRVTGAAGDQTLRLVSDRPEALCEATVSGGAAECVGTLITSGAPAQVTAELLPSGTHYQVLPPPDGTQENPSLQYTPLPSDASPPDVDEPASEV